MYIHSIFPCNPRKSNNNLSSSIFYTILNFHALLLLLLFIFLCHEEWVVLERLGLPHQYQLRIPAWKYRLESFFLQSLHPQKSFGTSSDTPPLPLLLLRSYSYYLFSSSYSSISSSHPSHAPAATLPTPHLWSFSTRSCVIPIHLLTHPYSFSPSCIASTSSSHLPLHLPQFIFPCFFQYFFLLGLLPPPVHIFFQYLFLLSPSHSPSFSHLLLLIFLLPLFLLPPSYPSFVCSSRLPLAPLPPPLPPPPAPPVPLPQSPHHVRRYPDCGRDLPGPWPLRSARPRSRIAGCRKDGDRNPLFYYQGCLWQVYD